MLTLRLPKAEEAKPRQIPIAGQQVHVGAGSGTNTKYERAGLVRPARQSGNQRLYSNADVRRLHRIRYLVEERGLNVAGLEITLRMLDRLEEIEPGSSRVEMRTAIDEVMDIGGPRHG